MKKRLSKILLNKILVVLISIFAGLMTMTAVFVFLYANHKTETMISFYLDDLTDYTYYVTEKHLKYDTRHYTDTVEHFIEVDGIELFTNPEYDAFIEDYFKKSLDYYNGQYNEINIVDGEGIIRISTVDEYVGYDMHSGEQSAEFLCLLNGTDVFVQDFKEISYDGSTRMRYAGAALKNTKGFLQIGLTEETYYSTCESYMISRIMDARIGRGGYYLLLDGEQKIISSPRHAYDGDVFNLPEDLKEVAETGRVVRCNVYGTDSYVSARAFQSNIMLAIYPVAEAWETWNVAMIVLIIIYVAVFVILFLLINRLMAKHFVKGVYSLNGSLSRITKGDLNEKADYRESLEFDKLSDGINFTVDRLKELIKEAEERIDAELALAASIQLSFIPHEFPAFPDRDEFELYASMIPAKEVGGDFYDFFLIDEDHLALVMADVSGKGIPAAMFMVMAKNKLHTGVMKYGTDVAGAMTAINRAILDENEAGLFVTVWLGVVTLSTGHVDYVDAGHDYPILRRDGGSFRLFPDVHDVLMGMVETEYSAGSFELSFGDVLFLYTDGMTEAHDPKDELFGEDRLTEALNRNPDAPLEELDANVRKAVEKFAEGRPQFDDMTTLALRYKKEKEASETENEEDWFL